MNRPLWIKHGDPKAYTLLDQERLQRQIRLAEAQVPIGTAPTSPVPARVEVRVPRPAPQQPRETASLATSEYVLPWEAARRAGGDPVEIGREWGCRWVEGQGWVPA